MLTTTVLACTCPKLVAPAMNTAMYQNPATQRNLEQLRQDGFVVIEPASGRLACGDAVSYTHLDVYKRQVYGLFGLLAFSQRLGMRYSILSGALTAALLILPTAAQTAHRAIQGTVQSGRTAARALGATEGEFYRGIVLPAARSGLVSAGRCV